MRSSDSKWAKLVRVTGRSGEAAFFMCAGIFIGGALFGLLGFAAGGHQLETSIGGGAVGAYWGALRVTRYKYALRSSLGATIGWWIGAVVGSFFTAVFAAAVGGYIGARAWSYQSTSGESAPSRKIIFQRILIAFGGVIVGGFTGAFIAGWACIIIVFRVPPWRLPGTVDQGGLLIFAVGVLGAVVGSVLGGRCLYLWAIRRSAAQSEPGPAIAEYKKWKEQNVLPSETDKLTHGSTEHGLKKLCPGASKEDS